MAYPTPINSLSSASSVAAGDSIPIYKSSQGDSRRVSITDLTAYLQTNLTFDADTFTTQYSSPLTGATVALTDTADNDSFIHLIITPAATIAALTLTMPIVPGAADGQEILVNCTQIITTLTISINGATAVKGAPTAFTANGFFRLKYDALMKTWYRIG